ncbi:hypothetical protein J4E90_008621 [Alternaria incomplexa]|uniref:uncharacterized protein n=1 Tax=Alternaria incomplexa TaxID=1187928 RepID=UPI00221FBFED|nr:uncharacterized protein J4E90_008621 [Alternaria incomplexa]KAI4908884.1 hypothetical protein J4E90_008621 [Alternaria incomplexa]
MSDCFDVLIIGGGLAGLSTALSLVRSLHTAVVFDSRAYRNRKANWLHTLPGWDGRDPEEYRAAARQNILSKYNTVQFATGVVIENVIRDADAEFPFTATDSKGRIWRGRKLVLAMGIQDVPVDELAAECREALGPLGFRVDARRIVRFIKEPTQAQVTAVFEDDEKMTEGFIIHRPLPLNNGAFAKQLGVETNDFGFYKTNPPFFETSVPGIFAAGDCGDPFKIGTFAVSMGAFVAGGLQMQLDAGSGGALGPAYQIVKQN